MYISTRGDEKVTASEAIIKGLSKEGGLFIPEKIKKLKINKEYILREYNEIAYDVFKIFLDDFTEEEIYEVIDKAYTKENFNDKMVGFKQIDKSMFLELYHGPTLAFKDMALTALPFLIEIAKRKNNETKRTMILVATSGDTGGAALSSFIRNKEFDTLVLYPNGGVSEIQEKQMLYYTNDQTKAVAVDGNFDDCQSFVKKIFNEYVEKNGRILSSANSINIGRLVPQVIYYVYSYVYMVRNGILKLGEKMDVCVPTGNFGDIFAGYLAKAIGVPIRTFICASNVNNVLTDFFNKGIYDKKREFHKSNSPAMDILISSNLERLLFYICSKKGKRVSLLMKDLKENGEYILSKKEKKNLKNFKAAYTTEEETIKEIGRVYKEKGYLIDPHTAVASDVYNKVGDKSVKTLIVSTASPFKFPYTVSKAIDISGEGSEIEIIKRIEKETGVEVPVGITKLFESDKKKVVYTREDILSEVYR